MWLIHFCLEVFDLYWGSNKTVLGTNLGQGVPMAGKENTNDKT